MATPTPPMPSPRPDSIPGLALSMESSFLGYFAHAGFLGALHAAGIYPDHLAGASSGSLIAVLAAAGFSTERIRQEIFNPAFKRAFWEWGSFPRMMGMTFWLRGATGFSSAAKARRHLELVFRDSAPRLENCRAAKVSVAVANLSRKRTEILESGASAEAIIASCAFPGLICPQKLAIGYCWDGGLADSCPFVHYASNPNVHTIITHHIDHPGHGDGWEKPDFVPRISDAMGRAHEVITRELRELHIAKVIAAGKTLLPVTTMVMRPGPVTSYKKLQQCYDAGWSSGSDFAASWSQRSPSPHTEL